MSGREIDTPFLLGLIDLEGGLGRMTARIEGLSAEELSIGMPVRLRLGDPDVSPPYEIVPERSDGSET